MRIEPVDTSDMTMLSLLDIYANHRRVSEQYLTQLQSKVRCFVAHVGNDDLKPADVNNFMVQDFINVLLETVVSETADGYKSAIRAVISLEKDLRKGKVVVPKGRHKIPEAFTIEQIRLLVKAAKMQEGKLPNGVRRKIFWLAAIHSAYSTGLRAGDLLRVLTSSIPKNRILDVLQNKTQKIVRVRFSKKAMKAIRKHGMDHVVPWPHSFTYFERKFIELRNQAGVDRGTWKWLRRSAGTYANRDGKGNELLGNNDKVFVENYCDPRLSEKMPPKQVKI